MCPYYFSEVKYDILNKFIVDVVYNHVILAIAFFSLLQSFIMFGVPIN
jgi:hypothetical protein